MKGIAIQKIILLLLGIIVLAMVGYLLYITFIGSKITPDICRAEVMRQCTQCKLVGWSSSYSISISGKSCTNEILTADLGTRLRVDTPISCDNLQGDCSRFGIS